MTALQDDRSDGWPRTAREAVILQRHLGRRVENRDRIGMVERVAGLDVSYDRETKTCRAAVAVLAFPDLHLLEARCLQQPTVFPYVPGLLSFREVPPLLAVMKMLSVPPDLLLCDGQGIAHPRRFGLACHMGVLLDIPAIGVAKSRLTGQFDEPGPARGARSDLIDKGEVIGAVLRTRANVSPLFVSIGHRVSLETAIRLVLACAPKWRLPETTRQADKLSKAWEPPGKLAGRVR